MPIRPSRLLSALRRPLRGASLAETGLLVGLVAVVAIAAVSVLGGEVREVFCRADRALGGEIACQEVATAPEDNGDTEVPGEPQDPEDAQAPIAPLTLAFDVPGDVFDLDDPQALRFTVGGLRDNATFDWQIIDAVDAPYLSGFGTISGTATSVTPEAEEPRPGRITLSVTAPLPDASIASAAPLSRELVTMETFPDSLDTEPSTTVTSEALPVIGLESTLQATLDVGTLLVNDEPVEMPATVTAGDSIAIALETSEDWTTATTATLTVGPLTRTFTADLVPRDGALSTVPIGAFGWARGRRSKRLRERPIPSSALAPGRCSPGRPGFICSPGSGSAARAGGALPADGGATCRACPVPTTARMPAPGATPQGLGRFLRSCSDRSAHGRPT